VCPLIEKCKSLRGLSLLRCSGPFTDALGASFRARRPLQLLQKLRIVDGARDITDNGLKTLLDRWILDITCNFGDAGLCVLLGEKVHTLCNARVSRPQGLTARLTAR